MLAIRYSDDTENETFAYNHLGQLTQVTDAAGTRTTRYNAADEALTSEEKTLISALDPVLESASISIDERGNETRSRTEYAGGTARLTLTETPGCSAPARVLSIDGFTIEQTDAAGVTTRAYTPALWYILWDSTQETATRPLAIQKNGTWYSAPARLASQGSRSQVCSRLGVWLLKPHPAYGWDLTKNICETYRTDGRIDLAYTYTPYGEVSPAHSYDQPLRWSSEYHDVELGLVYYNYRHYNPAMGRWFNYDALSLNSDYTKVSPIFSTDILGLFDISITVTYSYNVASVFSSKYNSHHFAKKGTEINDKLVITFNQRVECKNRRCGKPVIGPTFAPCQYGEGNHIISAYHDAQQNIMYSGKQVAEGSYISQRKHWSGSNKHINSSYAVLTPLSEPALNDETYYIIDVSTSAAAHREPNTTDDSSLGQQLRKDLHSAISSFVELLPMGTFINQSVPYIAPMAIAASRYSTGHNNIPEIAEAALSIRVITLCNPDGEGKINYMVFSSTTLPIGSTFKEMPGWETVMNTGKFTATAHVAIN